MAKFSSLDGTDKNGIRAEVVVQTGTGTISEIVGRGKQNEDGTYRNVEVVFNPDNPLLKRKVYGLLDTTSKDLWEYVQTAHKDQRTIAYRIESQRRAGVDRTLQMSELNATEQIRRILAAIDGVFSHEAKTNPAEDPSNENPSALDQPAATTTTAVSGAGIDPALLAEIKATLANVGTGFASPAFTAAATAEQFSLDHLIDLYTPAKSKSTIQVTDEIIAQAASVAHTLLGLADQVQVDAGVSPNIGPDRNHPSYTPALNLVLDAVAKRHPVPIGGDPQTQEEWSGSVVAEASERLYGLNEIAAGRLPKPEAERAGTPATTAAAPTEPTAAPVTVQDVANTFHATEVASFNAGTIPHEGEPGFVAPTDDIIGRLRDLCVTAHAADDTRAISDWIERTFGVRSARKVHGPALVAFCDHYEQAGPQQVRDEILSVHA